MPIRLSLPLLLAHDATYEGHFSRAEWGVDAGLLDGGAEEVECGCGCLGEVEGGWGLKGGGGGGGVEVIWVEKFEHCGGEEEEVEGRFAGHEGGVVCLVVVGLRGLCEVVIEIYAEQL